MDLPALVSTYGYAAVLVGTLLEGETILLLAGFAAHRGHLELPLVLACAVAGATAGDQLAFAAGRRYGVRLVATRPRLAAAVNRVLPRLRGRATWFVLVNRFLVGLRTAGPFAVGMTGMHWLRFAVLNLAGAVLWSAVVGGLGYVVGEGVERALGDLRHAEQGVLAAAIVAGLAYAMLRGWRSRRRAAAASRAAHGEQTPR